MLLGFFPRCKKFFFLISLLTMSCIAMAQRIVSGSILDENQKPVSDATVMVKALPANPDKPKWKVFNRGWRRGYSCY
jgi:hypothetical protein